MGKIALLIIVVLYFFVLSLSKKFLPVFPISNKNDKENSNVVNYFNPFKKVEHKIQPKVVETSIPKHIRYYSVLDVFKDIWNDLRKEFRYWRMKILGLPIQIHILTFINILTYGLFIANPTSGIKHLVLSEQNLQMVYINNIIFYAC